MITAEEANEIVRIADYLIDTAREQKWSEDVYYDAVAKIFNEIDEVH